MTEQQHERAGEKISLLQTLAVLRLADLHTITAEPKLCRQVIRQANAQWTGQAN